MPDILTIEGLGNVADLLGSLKNDPEKVAPGMGYFKARPKIASVRPGKKPDESTGLYPCVHDSLYPPGTPLNQRKRVIQHCAEREFPLCPYRVGNTTIPCEDIIELWYWWNLRKNGSISLLGSGKTVSYIKSVLKKLKLPVNATWNQQTRAEFDRRKMLWAERYGVVPGGSAGEADLLMQKSSGPASTKSAQKGAASMTKKRKKAMKAVVRSRPKIPDVVPGVPGGSGDGDEGINGLIDDLKEKEREMYDLQEFPNIHGVVVEDEDLGGDIGMAFKEFFQGENLKDVGIHGAIGGGVMIAEDLAAGMLMGVLEDKVSSDAAKTAISAGAKVGVGLLSGALLWNFMGPDAGRTVASISIARQIHDLVKPQLEKSPWLAEHLAGSEYSPMGLITADELNALPPANMGAAYHDDVGEWQDVEVEEVNGIGGGLDSFAWVS